MVAARGELGPTLVGMGITLRHTSINKASGENAGGDPRSNLGCKPTFPWALVLRRK